MLLNINDINKLSDAEKLQLVDEILDSIDNSVIKNYISQQEDETDNILKERWEEYQSGRMKFDTWENVYRRLQEKTKSRNENQK